MGTHHRNPNPNSNPSNNTRLNPNWVHLQQKLKIHGSRPSHKPSCDAERHTPEIILGKRKERPDAEPDASQKHILLPTNTDCSLTDAVAMDCEMVGVSSQGNKSALGRVTLVNKWGNVIYDEYVRPVERVVDFRTEISGIRPRDLKKARDFHTVQRKVAELIKGRILVGHALRNDLKVLLLSHPKTDMRDTSECELFLKEGRRRVALRHLAADFLGVKIQNGEHCPVEDARAAMLLYQRKRRQWEKNIKDQIRLKRKQNKRKQKKKKNETDGLDANNTATT